MPGLSIAIFSLLHSALRVTYTQPASNTVTIIDGLAGSVCAVGPAAVSAIRPPLRPCVSIAARHERVRFRSRFTGRTRPVASIRVWGCYHYQPSPTAASHNEAVPDPVYRVVGSADRVPRKLSGKEDLRCIAAAKPSRARH